MPTIVGDSFGDVERLWLADRAQKQAGIENALSRLMQTLAQRRASDESRKDRDLRERTFNFQLAREASDIANDQARLGLSREELDERIRANKEREKFNFQMLEQPKASVAAAEAAGRSRMDLENLKQGERTRENYNIARNMSELLNQYQGIPDAEADMAQWLPGTKKRAEELDTFKFGFGRSAEDAARMALDERRGQIPYNIPIDVTQDDTAEALASRASGALATRKETLGSAIDQGMRTGADLIRQDQSGRWYPGVPAYNMPQGPAPSAPSRGAMMRSNPKVYQFAEQHQAVTNAIDKVQTEMPSFLLAPPELHPQIKEARKQGKDLLRNLSTEKKDIEKQLDEIQKEEEAKAEKAKEQGTKAVDVKQFSFSNATRPNPDEVRRQAQAAIARGKDPVAVYRRALELGIDLNQ